MNNLDILAMTLRESNNNSILKSINEILDRTDPTQKALALLASLVDSRFNQSSQENSDQHEDIIKKIEVVSTAQVDMTERIIELENPKACILGYDTKHESLEKRLKFILFIVENPIIAGILIIGIFGLLGIGTDKLLAIMGLIK